MKAPRSLLLAATFGFFVGLFGAANAQELPVIVPKGKAQAVPPVIPFTFAAFHNAPAIPVPGTGLRLDVGDKTLQGTCNLERSTRGRTRVGDFVNGFSADGSAVFATTGFGSRLVRWPPPDLAGATIGDAGM